MLNWWQLVIKASKNFTTVHLIRFQYNGGLELNMSQLNKRGGMIDQNQAECHHFPCFHKRIIFLFTLPACLCLYINWQKLDDDLPTYMVTYLKEMRHHPHPNAMQVFFFYREGIHKKKMHQHQHPHCIPFFPTNSKALVAL